MYRSQKNQPLKNRNTQPKNTDARKEIEAEEKEAKKDPGEKFIDMLLKTGNENVNKELFGNQTGQGEEEEEDLFDFFKEDPKENKKPAVSEIKGMQEKDVEEGNIFDLSNDNIIEPKNEIISTASKKNTDRKNRRQTFIPAKDRLYRSFMRIRSRKKRHRPLGIALKLSSKNLIRLPLI